MKDMIGLNDGTVLVNVHTVEQCGGRPCVVHNPSQHHMLLWPAQWDQDLKFFWRMCPHGFYHPDPDDFAFRVERDPGFRLVTTHECDACCFPWEQKAIGS